MFTEFIDSFQVIHSLLHYVNCSFLEEAIWIRRFPREMMCKDMELSKVLVNLFWNVSVFLSVCVSVFWGGEGCYFSMYSCVNRILSFISLVYLFHLTLKLLWYFCKTRFIVMRTWYSLLLGVVFLFVFSELWDFDELFYWSFWLTLSFLFFLTKYEYSFTVPL